jgi:signal peptidase I
LKIQRLLLASKNDPEVTMEQDETVLGPPPAEVSREGRVRRWKTVTGVLTVSFWLCTAAAAANLRAYSIPSASMSPTLTRGDRVLALTRFASGAPKRGEVWVFRSASGPTFVKRVVAVPGDTVVVKSGRLIVNALPVSEPYAGPAGYNAGPLTLGAGQYYVLGDNRRNSNDSHVFGPVQESALIGRVQVRYWPPQRIGGV